MSTAEITATVAQQLLEWRASGTPRQPISALPSGDLDAAYSTQERLVDLLQASGGGQRVGYKIALTSATMQAMCGVDHPLAGVLLSGAMRDSGAQIALRDFQRVGIECEVAVRLGETLNAADAPFDRHRVARSVCACAPAFELVEDGNADYDTVDAIMLIADNAWNGANVVGEFVERSPQDWLADSFGAARTALTIDGDAAGEGHVRDALGHPFEAVAWVANLLAKRGVSIQRDMLVMTGSSIRTVFPTQPGTLHFDIESLGSVEFELAG